MTDLLEGIKEVKQQINEGLEYSAGETLKGTFGKLSYEDTGPAGDEYLFKLSSLLTNSVFKKSLKESIEMLFGNIAFDIFGANKGGIKFRNSGFIYEAEGKKRGVNHVCMMRLNIDNNGLKFGDIKVTNPRDGDLNKLAQRAFKRWGGNLAFILVQKVRTQEGNFDGIKGTVQFGQFNISPTSMSGIIGPAVCKAAMEAFGQASAIKPRKMRKSGGGYEFEVDGTPCGFAYGSEGLIATVGY